MSHDAARSDKTALHSENDQDPNIESVIDEALMDIMALLCDDEAFLKNETPVSAELKAVMALLEKLGLNGSPAEQMVLPGAGSALENASDPAAKGQNPLVALKQLIEQIQSSDFKPGNDMSTGLERLRLVIAQALTGGVSAPGGGQPQSGLNLSEATGTVDVASEFKGLTQGQEKAININGVTAEDRAGGEKPGEPPSTATRPANETENVPKVPGPMKTVENSQIAVQSENAEKSDAAKLPPDTRKAAEANEIAKAPQFTEEGPGKPVNSSPSSSSVDSRRQSGGQPSQENSLTGDSSPISKLINDAQVEKENPLKVDAAAGDNAGSKVVKIEAATHDNGQLSSQAQTSEKTPESVSSPKETEAVQRELQTRTLEQIVRRAVIQVRDGRHEARIELKPDFLGHVRMQVITENQQVTVKILTEFAFVKEMIDNNIQQLKADLQHQGLEVDKLDVSVSRDANGNKQPQENMQHARNLNRKDNSEDPGDPREEREEPTDQSAPRGQGVLTVDYFA